MVLLTAEGVMQIRRAAALMLPVCMTAWKTSSWRRFMGRGCERKSQPPADYSAGVATRRFHNSPPCGNKQGHTLTEITRMLASLKFKNFLAGLALAASATLAAAQGAKPNVVILATGGTIAGAGA